MIDLDKEWIPVVLAVVVPLLGGIGWWFRAMREDRLREALARKEDKLKDLAKIEELQSAIFKMQQDRIADEANKRKEVDTTVKLMNDMTILLKAALTKNEKEGS